MPNLQTLKERPGLWLIAGSMVTSAPRYVGAFANAEGFRITSSLWDALHATSGLGMAVLEAVAVWYCATALSRHGRRDPISILLASLIVAMFIVLAWTIAPYIMSSANGKMVVALLDNTGQWTWSFALTLAPLFVMAASGIAEHLSTHRPAGATLDARFARVDETLSNLNATIVDAVTRVSQVEQRASIQVLQIAQQVAQLQQPEEEPQQHVAQLASPDRLELSNETLAAALADNPNTTNVELARLFGVTPQAISARRRRATP